MTTLTEFLLQNPVNDVTDEVALSERISKVVDDGKGGTKKEPYKFMIKAVTGDEFAEYQKLCLTYGKKGKVSFDNNRLNQLLVINHTVDPDFKNADNIKKAGCITPEQYMKKVLLAGEIVTLAQKISELSGFDKEIDELVEEAKN